MNLTRERLIPVAEFALRLYLAYMMIEYGTSKFTGDMFANTTDRIRSLPLSEVDMFHLTWYWFQKNVVLSYFVGAVQLTGAVLLLFNRTVLLACLLLAPVLIGIFLVDVYCVPGPALAVRIFLYDLIIVCLCIYRRKQVKQLWYIMTRPSEKSGYRLIPKILLVIVCLPLFFIIEWVLVKAGALLFG